MTLYFDDTTRANLAAAARGFAQIAELVAALPRSRSAEEALDTLGSMMEWLKISGPPVQSAFEGNGLGPAVDVLEKSIFEGEKEAEAARARTLRALAAGRDPDEEGMSACSEKL